MQEMINWPTADKRYQDSGEGGLFAWMVVPEAVTDGDAAGANVYGNNCCVDVSGYLSRPRAMITRPDACVSPERVKLYEPYDYRNSWFDQQRKIEEALGGPQANASLVRAVRQTMGSDDLSVPLLASTFLGSTCLSLWDEQAGAYFAAGFEHLTDPGKRIYEAQREAYGVEPIILTFLDT